MTIPPRASEDFIVIPRQDLKIKIAPVDYVIAIPKESRKIKVERATIMAYSRTHVVANKILWHMDYHQWLDVAANVVSATVTSNSQTLTVTTPTPLGDEITFFVVGGTLNEVATVSVQMTDNLGNIKNDAIQFTVVSP
jgi:hypothetical protein